MSLPCEQAGRSHSTWWGQHVQCPGRVSGLSRSRQPCASKPAGLERRSLEAVVGNKGLSSQSYGFSSRVMYGCESWTIRKLSTKELMLLNCGVGEDS